MNNLPTGTVTFLFTDIEGSTKLAQQLHDRWEILRTRHHEILQSAIDSYHGYVFQIIGDAFCTAFHTAGDALRAAAKSQIDLHAENWGDTPIRVRMGIHTGKAEIQQDGQYQGYLAMSRVQRLMSAGHGGQALISATTQELLLEDLPENVSLRDLGEHKLKDLIRPEHVYQLVVPNLPIDFPPIKSLNAIPNNLPIQLTSFIGREKELDELKELVAKTRLLTLTGVGGTGKTRLALHVAADEIDHFNGGVWLVELASLSDPELVPQAVATALGLREQAGRALLDMLKDYFSSKTLLLVLDNCEHLIETCAQLADTLLHAATRLKILATSREALGIAGETTYPVRSLSLPEAHQVMLNNLSEYDAVRLFVDRAAAALPNFQVTYQNAPAVAQICVRLDGIPLAIELAAARVKGLSSEQIASRLSDRFRLLTGGSRTALPRQRTLQATIDWSYRLLAEEERVLLRRLSVFVGGWTLEAAEQVCAGNELEQDQVLDQLLRLVDKSLILAETDISEPRYHMLETIRQYAQEKLDEAKESIVLRDRHLAYFLTIAEEAEPHITSAQQSMWLERLETELDNIRAALNWAQDGGSVEAGLRLATDLGMFWFFRTRFREACIILENLLTKAQSTLNILLLARAHHAMAYLYAYSGYSATGRAHAQAGERLLLKLGDAGKADLAGIRDNLILTDVEIAGDPIRTREALEENLKLYQEVGDLWGIAHTLAEIAEQLKRSNEMMRAKDLDEQALALFRECGDSYRVAQQHASLAGYLFLEGKYAEARAFLEQVLSFYRQAPVHFAVDVPLWLLGAIAIREEDYVSAKAWYTECILFDQQIGWPKSQFPECLIGFAGIANAERRFERAAQLLGGVWAEVETRDYPALENFDQAELEHLTRVVREELGDAKFEALAAQGRSMTFVQIVAFALEGRNE